MAPITVAGYPVKDPHSQPEMNEGSRKAVDPEKRHGDPGVTAQEHTAGPVSVGAGRLPGAMTTELSMLTECFP